MIGRAEVANNSDLNTIQARKEIISILYSLRDYSHFFRLVKTPKKGSQVQNPVHHEQKQKLSKLNFDRAVYAEHEPVEKKLWDCTFDLVMGKPLGKTNS